MQLEHDFVVPAPVEQAWKVLLDVERVAPCMPGATLETVEGDDFTGRVKVKVGAIGLTYGGKASFVETDEAAHRVVIDGTGRETRGSGTAKATVTATLTGEGDRTRVHVVTDLAVTGKPAQFGRGVMSDVAGKLIGRFADCLAEELGDPAGSARAAQPGAADAATGSARPPVASQRRSAEEIDLLEVAGGSLAKRAAYVAVPAVALAVLVVLLRRLRS